MASLAPPSVNRARSSSTAGNLTTARPRANSSVVQPSSSSQILNSSAPSLPPPANNSSMLNVLFAVAYNAVPHALAAVGIKGKGRENGKDIGLASLEPTLKVLEKEVKVSWDDKKTESNRQKSLRQSFESTSSRSHSKRSGRRNRSPFASLFIPPPEPSLPQPVSSPRSSFSSLPHFSLSLPVPSVAYIPPPRLLLPLLLICSAFVLTLLPIIVSIWTLPIKSLKSFPRTMSDISLVAKEMQAYADSSFVGMAHIVSVLAITSIWKNAWSIPGSALLNVLAGALMNPLLATILQTALTTIGSLCSTLLSKPLAPIITFISPKIMNITRSAFEGSSPTSSPELSPITPNSPNSDPFASQQKKQTPIWVRLTILRLVGVVPWSGLNLACGICDVPLWDCAVGAFIGSLPWTAVTCQVRCRSLHLMPSQFRVILT
ncbi:hypothetical protein FRC02_010188 [Tulasnella sp. 418]|nr:hypothetical protein FRC02_010188 [Tulasnella sp. 418]